MIDYRDFQGTRFLGSCGICPHPPYTLSFRFLTLTLGLHFNRNGEHTISMHNAWGVGFTKGSLMNSWVESLGVRV